MNTLRFLISLAQMKRHEKMTAPQLKRFQRSELLRLLHYAYDHSTYYKTSFEEAGITKDTIDKLPLTAFPTINKDVLMTNFDTLVTQPGITQEALRLFDEDESSRRKNYLGKYHIVHSSGSTGTPRYFVYDEKAWERMLTGIIRGGLWDVSVGQFFKWYANHPRVLYIAATDGRYGGAMAVSDGINGLGVKQISLDIGTPLSEWVKVVRDFQPNFIVGYPSAIKILGEMAKENDLSLRVNRVFSCGEPLSAGLRQYLEHYFSAEVINFYGASESLALGMERSPNEGMVLFDDLNIIEVIDGQMYLTCLYNYLQPLIRYSLSDKLVLRKTSSDEPSAFTRTDVLLCRNEDVLWFRDEAGNREFLHPLSIEGFCVDGLIDYQFCQTSEQSFEMRLQLADPSQEAQVRAQLEPAVNQVLRLKGLGYVSMEMRIVDEILPDPQTGKKSLVICAPGGLA